MIQKTLTLITLFLFCGLWSSAQSTIYKSDGDEIKAEIVEIQEEFIKYRKFGDPNKTLRNIRVSDVFMIIYPNGDVEKFEAAQPAVDPQPAPVLVETSAENNPITETPEQVQNMSNPNEGFIIGGRAGFFIPYNEVITDMYGPGFMFGLVLGYWGAGSGFEINWRFYMKEGDPYTYGSASDAESDLSISPLTITGYWKFFSNGKFETYAGGGLGAAFIEENLSATLAGQPTSDTFEATGLELHTTGGFRVKPFYMELTFSSITIPDFDINFGGIIISGGFFF